MSVLDRQLWHKVIVSIGLVVAGFSARHYREDFARFIKPKGIKQIEALAREQKTFEAVLVAIELIGKDLERNETISKSVEKNLQYTVPILRERQRFPEDITANTFGPGANFATGFVTGHQDGSIRFWQSDGTATKKTIQTHKDSQKSNINEIIFDSEGKKMLVGFADGEIQIWNVDKSALLNSWSSGMSISKLAIAPDGKIIVATGGEKSGAVGVWDEKGKVIRSPKQAHWLYANNIVFTPNGQKFITSDVWGRVLEWNRDGQPLNKLETLETESTYYNKLAVSFPPESKGNYYYIYAGGLFEGSLQEGASSSRGISENKIGKLYVPDMNQQNGENNKFILQNPIIWSADFGGYDYYYYFGYLVISYVNLRDNEIGFIQAYAPYDTPIGNLIPVDGRVYGLEKDGIYVAGKVRNENGTQLRLWEYHNTRTEDGKGFVLGAHKYRDWESLLEHACFVLKTYENFDNSVSVTRESVTKTCKKYKKL